VDGWLRLDELAVGTRVAVPRRVPAPRQRCGWDAEEVHHAARHVVEGIEHLPSDCPLVPRAIFSLPDDALVAFLGALWPNLDGVSHHGHRPRLHCVSASTRLVDDVQTLLLRLEVHSRVVRLGPGAGAGRARLSIEGEESQRRFVELMADGAAAGDEAGRTFPRLSGEIPVDALALAGRRSGHRLGVPSRYRLAQVAAALDDAALDRRARADVRWDPVVAIDALGEQPVYDATVAETHNFVANGIVVENSLEQDADVVVFFYRDELYHPESPDRGTAEVLVAKHRSGPTGMDRLAFLDHYTRFANMAKGI
ncbi:MAG TPA: DnaB-like helicase C-terminal domain-containing protein, partial [Acidimicrobiales bacterium]|nr:DnaB-like helicase C-terminal domain-containing protein [Acidimicrobiales bacterium]